MALKVPTPSYPTVHKPFEVPPAESLPRCSHRRRRRCPPYVHPANRKEGQA